MEPARCRNRSRPCFFTCLSTLKFPGPRFHHKLRTVSTMFWCHTKIQVFVFIQDLQERFHVLFIFETNFENADVEISPTVNTITSYVDMWHCQTGIFAIWNEAVLGAAIILHDSFHDFKFFGTVKIHKKAIEKSKGVRNPHPDLFFPLCLWAGRLT